MRIRPARLASVLLGSEAGFPLVGFGPAMFLRLAVSAGANTDLLITRVSESRGSLRCYEDFLEELENGSVPPNGIDRIINELFSDAYVSLKAPGFSGNIRQVLASLLRSKVLETGVCVSDSGQISVVEPAISGKKTKDELLLTEYVHPALTKIYVTGVNSGLFDGQIIHAAKVINDRLSQYCVDVSYGRLNENDAVNRIFDDVSRNPFRFSRDTDTGKSAEPGLKGLFNGLFGYFRNPAAHEKIYINDIKTFVRAMMFFSQILHVLDCADMRGSK